MAVEAVEPVQNRLGHIRNPVADMHDTMRQPPVVAQLMIGHQVVHRFLEGQDLRYERIQAVLEIGKRQVNVAVILQEFRNLAKRDIQLVGHIPEVG